MDKIRVWPIFMALTLQLFEKSFKINPFFDNPG